MKNQVLFLAIIAFISANVAAQQRQTHSRDSALIIQLENNWAKALITHNEPVFNKLLATGFIYTENEKMYSREDVIRSAMSVEDTIRDAYNKDMQVRIKDKTAIVTGWLFVNGKNTGGTFKRKYRFTDVWYNIKGAWQLIAAQDYLLP